MKIYTSTPVAFGGGPDFFERDSGLLCRGFQSIGIESRAVMPGERKPEDEADLIRTVYANLESAEWWKSHGLDGVVLYAWGRPKFRKIAKAIHDAGIFLVLNQDNGGLISPLAGPLDWLVEQRNLAGRHRGFPGWMKFASLVLRGVSLGLAVTDPLRALHLKHGDVIACVSPKAAQCYRRWCRIHGGKTLSDRVTVLPHCVTPTFRWSGAAKKRQVVCVGRWDDLVQKRPNLLSGVMAGLLEADLLVTALIIGPPDNALVAWHQSLSEMARARVRLEGRVGRRELQAWLDESQIFYSPSAFESFGIAAAEALCCGCSVVASKSVSMVSFEWFVSEESGTLADADDVNGHVGALVEELRIWDQGNRNPQAISRVWGGRFHADKVAERVIGMMS